MKKLFLLLLAVLSIGLCASAQTRTVRGTVVGAEDNEPLVGVSVKAVGAEIAATTDIDGKFSIVVPTSVKELTFSFIGMTPVTLPISNNMTVTLESADKTLGTMVVTGYGSAKKLGTVVGSVNVVGEKVLEDTPSTNFVDALQGQVPGLAIYSNTGEPSAVASSIRIRGVNSISASNTPLFICDGAPVSSAIFNSLSNSDIENITVLKDASSTAIYGSRAANGVIVITTKRGKFEQKASVTIRANMGWSDATQDKLDMMGSADYIKFRDMLNTYNRNTGELTQGGYGVSQAERDAWEKYGISTNWRDELINNGAPTYSLEATVRGGGQTSNYYFSLNHYDQDGVIFRSGIRRESIRMSINSKVTNWFRAGANANLGYEAYQTNGNAGGTGLYTYGNPFFQSYMLLPFDSPRYYQLDNNGNIQYGEKAVWYKYSSAANAEFYAGKSHSYRSNVTLNMNLYEEIYPVKGLTLRAAQALTAFDYRNTTKSWPQESFTTPMGDFVDMSSFTGYRGESFQRYYQFTYTNTAEYKFNIANRHDFTFLVGQESIISRTNQFNVTTNGQENAVLSLLTNGIKVEMSNVGQSISETVMNSYFGQLNYAFDDKYFVDLSIRRDGSSKFSKANRWSTFWSAGAMWNMKNEDFLKGVNWLTDAKIRFNYGTTGNSGIGNYAFMGSIVQGNTYNGEPSFGLGSPTNNSLTWETVEQFDLGINAGFWNRLNITADFYVKNTKDMLMSVPVSVGTGYTSLAFNVGSMRNTGVDMEITGIVYTDKDWNIGLRANFGYNKNEITKLFDGKDSYNMDDTGLVLEVGSDVHQMRTVRYKGVEPETGRQMWLDKQGNITYEFSSDNAVPLGKSYNAPWTGGFGLDARWKGISLRADFSWAAEKYMFNWARNWYGWTANYGQNQIKEMLKMWQKPGDVTTIPNRFATDGSNQTANNPRADDRWLENASFIRMKNLTLSYSLPKTWMKAAKLESVNLHFTGRNLLTFTGFTGQDPEIENNAVYISYPNTRQYEFGIDVTF